MRTKSKFKWEQKFVLNTRHNCFSWYYFCFTTHGWFCSTQHVIMWSESKWCKVKWSLQKTITLVVRTTFNVATLASSSFYECVFSPIFFFLSFFAIACLSKQEKSSSKVLWLVCGVMLLRKKGRRRAMKRNIAEATNHHWIKKSVSRRDKNTSSSGPRVCIRAWYSATELFYDDQQIAVCFYRNLNRIYMEARVHKASCCDKYCSEYYGKYIYFYFKLILCYLLSFS